MKILFVVSIKIRVSLIYSLHYRWRVTRFTLGAISQPHQLLIEMTVPYSNSSIAVDNIHLIDCFPGNYYLYLEITPMVNSFATGDSLVNYDVELRSFSYQVYETHRIAILPVQVTCMKQVESYQRRIQTETSWNFSACPTGERTRKRTK